MVDVGSVPAVVTGNNDGMGGQWIWAIVLIALLGFGRKGYGDDCGGGGRVDNEVNFAELNGRFNSLERQIDNVDDMAQLRANYKEVCDTHMSVLESKYETGKEIMQNRYDFALGFKDQAMQLADCCCTTNRNIDSVKWEIERSNCELLGAISAEGQRTRDLIQGYEYQKERDARFALENKVSQLEQTAAITNFITPRAVPAYAACNPQIPIQANLGAGGGCCNGYGYAY